MAVTCRNIRELRDAFLDGDLSPSLMAEVHAHLLQCPECQQQMEMLRAVGDVIARDKAAPALDQDFASRVVASIPAAIASNRSVAVPPRSLTWHLFTRLSVPAAAAVLLMAIAFWPHEKDDTTRPTAVAGTTAVKQMVDPTLSAVADTQKTAANLNRLIKLSMDQATQNVREEIARSGQLRRAGDDFSITDVLLQPIHDMLKNPAPAESDNPDVVRF